MRPQKPVPLLLKQIDRERGGTMDNEQRLAKIASLLKRACDLRTRAAGMAAKAAGMAAKAAELEYKAAKLRAGK